MIAVDEIPVLTDQGSQMMADQRGASKRYTLFTGNESVYFTCILSVHLDGKQAPPLTNSKNKEDKIKCVSSMYVIKTEKAWFTQAATRRWADLRLTLLLQGSQRGPLVCYSVSTHSTKDVKNFFAERRMDQMMIPLGITISRLDIAISKPFKNHSGLEIR